MRHTLRWSWILVALVGPADPSAALAQPVGPVALAADPAATPAATRAAIQSAFDGLPKLGFHERAEVRLGPGVFVIDRPISLERAGIALIGAGRGRTILRYAGGTVGPIVTVGMPRFPFDPGHAVDAFGKLDATAAPTPGARWALASKGDSWVVMGGSPWMGGPPGGWNTTSTAVVELALDGPAPVGFSFGASATAFARPFFFCSTPGAFVVGFGVDAGLAAAETKTSVRFPPLVALPAGKHVLVAQVDLDDAEPVRLWVDGRRLEPRDRPTIPAGSKLARNRETPWKLGPPSERGTSARSDSFDDAGGKLGNWTVLGARASAGRRYKTDAVLARVDGAAITDKNTLIDRGPGVVAALSLADDPATVSAARQVSSLDGPTGWKSLGFWVEKKHGDSFTFIDGVEVRGITFQASPTPLGEALALGSVTSFKASDCEFSGGMHGVSTWNWGAGYVDRFRDCLIAGRSVSIYNYMRMMEFDSVDFGAAGRSALVNRMGQVRLRGGFIPQGTAGVTETFVESWSGRVVLDGLDVDNESPTTPLVAHFLAAPGEGGGRKAGAFVLRDVGLGQVRGDQPIVMLVDRGRPNAATLTIDTVLDFYGTPGCLVDCPGGWTGHVSVTGVPGFDVVTGAGKAGIVVAGPPTVSAPVAPAPASAPARGRRKP